MSNFMSTFTTHMIELVILLFFIFISFYVIPKTYKRELYSKPLKRTIGLIFSTLNWSLCLTPILMTICLHPEYGKEYIVYSYILIPLQAFFWGMSWVIWEVVVNDDKNKKHLEDQRVSYEKILQERRLKQALSDAKKAYESGDFSEDEKVKILGNYVMESIDRKASNNNALL